MAEYSIYVYFQLILITFVDFYDSRYTRKVNMYTQNVLINLKIQGILKTDNL